MNLLWLGVLAAIGGLVRETLGPDSLWVIVAVNLCGSFVLGGIQGVLTIVRSAWLQNVLKYGVAAGFTGSMTTFSSYILDVVRLFRNHPLEATALAVFLPVAGLAMAWMAQWMLTLLPLAPLRRLRGDTGHQ